MQQFIGDTRVYLQQFTGDARFSLRRFTGDARFNLRHFIGHIINTTDAFCEGVCVCFVRPIEHCFVMPIKQHFAWTPESVSTRYARLYVRSISQYGTCVCHSMWGWCGLHGGSWSHTTPRRCPKEARCKQLLAVALKRRGATHFV